MSNLLKIELEKPICFLALEWREHWEFDHPSVLLEPIFQYSPIGTSIESLIEDAAIDIACWTEANEDIEKNIHPSDQKEFDWRGWNVDELRQKAEALLRGEKVKLGTGYVAVREQWVCFWKTNEGEIEVTFMQPVREVS